MKNYLFILFLLVSLGSIGQVKNQKNLTTKIPNSTKELDIPTYPNSDETPFVFWHFCKQKEQQLNLSSLETNTSDSLTYRLWITNPIRRKKQPAGLLEIKNTAEGWKGEVILMSVNVNKRKLTETITKSKRIPVEPKSLDWQTIIDSLDYYKFSTLPTDDEIPKYYETNEAYGNNLQTFSFEYSTPKIYRFYQYNNIYRAIDKFWQPKNVVAILDILEKEFEWNSIGEEYFKK